MLRFTSDPNKAAQNLLKHGVSFEEASTVFRDPLASGFFDDEHSEQEERSIAIGRSSHGRLLYVVYTEAEPQYGPDQLIRILGARSVTARERRAHEQSLPR